MKVSYNWLQEYFAQKLPKSDELAEILTSLGLEVEKIITQELSKDYLSQFIISEVLEVSEHPNADKLRLAKINDGNKNLNIVCGAPNLFVGQKVVLAPIDSVIKINEEKNLKIKKSKIRGEISEGMLCSEKEIGISDNHNEIMSLPANAKTGDQLSIYYNSSKADTIFEIAITPNRGDALSYLGLALDIGAKLNTQVIYPKLHCESVIEMSGKNKFPLKINIQEEKECIRYMSVKINDISVSKTPEPLKNKLLSVGVKSINNIVDIANFVMLEIGQPIHAFDLDLIKGSAIAIRLANKGEKILTLDSKNRDLDKEILIIADNEQPLCIAGLIGGLNSAINSNTKNILLEFAHFTPKAIRRSTKKYNLVTDSAFRFERYVDPNLADIALRRMLYLMRDNNIIADKNPIEIFDYYPKKIDRIKISISFVYINKCIGIDIPKSDIIKILNLLDFKILEHTDKELLLAIPTNKIDVKEPIDVVEEILRIYGYDRVEKQSKANIYTQKNYKSEFIYKIHNLISDFLTARGYYEVINNSLTKNINLTGIIQEDIIKITNPLSQDLNILRYSLLPSILDNISYNKKRQKHDIKIFEIGSIYSNKIEYTDSMRLAIAITGMKNGENWTQKQQKATFFSLKGIVESLLTKLGVNFYTTFINKNIFSNNILNFVNSSNKVFVELGEVKADVLKKYTINSEVFYAEINLSEIINIIFKLKIKKSNFSSYPSVRRDLSLLLKDNISYETLVKEAKKVSGELLKNINIFDLYLGDKIPKGYKSYSISFILQSNDKTLSENEIEKIMNNVIQQYKSIGIDIRAN